jgi:hypothetical protein
MKHHIRRVLLPLAVVAAFLAAIACSDSRGPTEPRGRFDQRVTLRAGQLVRITSEGIEIGFQEITHDSRCPIEAVCVWVGEVRGSFGLGPIPPRASPTQTFELSTLQPRTVEVQGYRVTLESVSPAATGPPIPPGDYLAELRIQRD